MPRIYRRSAYQLYVGEVALPPEEALVSRAEGRHAVVGVHEDMDEGVDEGAKERCAQWIISP